MHTGLNSKRPYVVTTNDAAGRCRLGARLVQIPPSVSAPLADPTAAASKSGQKSRCIRRRPTPARPLTSTSAVPLGLQPPPPPPSSAALALSKTALAAIMALSLVGGLSQLGPAELSGVPAEARDS